MNGEFEPEPGALVGNYELNRLLTKYPGSEVWASTDGVKERPVSMRVMRKSWVWENGMTHRVQREIQMMQELKHPCILQLLEVFNSSTHVFMVMEHLGGRKLSEELAIKGRFGEDKARSMFLQVMHAMRYMHSMGIAHRGIRLESLVLAKDGNNVKVSEFGSAIRLGDLDSSHAGAGADAPEREMNHAVDDRHPLGFQAISHYTPPELCDGVGRHDGRAVDVWCAAVVLFAMVTGGMPFAGTGAEDIKLAIKEMEPTFPGYLSTDIKELLRGMLRKDPGERLSIPGVFAHGWTNRLGSIRSSKMLFNSASLSTLGTPRTVAAAAADAEEAAVQAAMVAMRAALEARMADKNAEQALAAATADLSSCESEDRTLRGAEPSFHVVADARSPEPPSLAWSPMLGTMAGEDGSSTGSDAGGEFPEETEGAFEYSSEIFKRHASLREEARVVSGSASTATSRRILLSRPVVTDGNDRASKRPMSMNSSSLAAFQIGGAAGSRNRGAAATPEDEPKRSASLNSSNLHRPSVHYKHLRSLRQSTGGGTGTSAAASGRPDRDVSDDQASTGRSVFLGKSSRYVRSSLRRSTKGMAKVTPLKERLDLENEAEEEEEEQGHEPGQEGGGVGQGWIPPTSWGLGTPAAAPVERNSTREREIIPSVSKSTTMTLSPLSETMVDTDENESAGEVASRGDDVASAPLNSKSVGSGNVRGPDGTGVAGKSPLNTAIGVSGKVAVAVSEAATSLLMGNHAAMEGCESVADTDADISPLPEESSSCPAHGKSPRLCDLGAAVNIWENDFVPTTSGGMNIDLVIPGGQKNGKHGLNKVYTNEPEVVPEQTDYAVNLRRMSWTGNGKPRDLAMYLRSQGMDPDTRAEISTANPVSVGEVRSISCRESNRRRESMGRKRAPPGLFRRFAGAKTTATDDVEKACRLPTWMTAGKCASAQGMDKDKAPRQEVGKDGEASNQMDIPVVRKPRRGLRKKLARVLGIGGKNKGRVERR